MRNAESVKARLKNIAKETGRTEFKDCHGVNVTIE